MQTISPDAPNESTDEVSIARQPIVDAQRTVVAYELFNRVHSVAGDAASSHAPFALQSLVESGVPFATSKCDLFINSVHKALEGPHWDFIDPAKTVVEVPAVPGHAPEQIAEIAVSLQRLRERGFRLSFNHSVVAPLYKPWQPFANFVQLELSPSTQPNLRPLMAAIQSRTGAKVVAHNISSAEQFALFQSLGVERFQGAWFSVPEVVQPRVMSPSESAALKLFNMVRQEAPLDAVELLLKKDAVLGVSLLRIINSAAMGLKQPVTSLRQAVQLMGYEKLGRWSAMLMVLSSHGSSSLLGASAAVRGRMMELLAQNKLSNEDPGTAFLVGMLSLLDRMFGMPMGSLLESLELDAQVRAALLERSGKFGDMLSLVVACESDDEKAFSEVFARLPFSGHEINMAHLEALAWADNLG